MHSILKEQIYLFDHLFPSIDVRMYIINLNPIYRQFANLINKFAPKEFQSRMRFLGEDFLTEMSKDIPLANIPKQFGGECEHELTKYPNIFQEELRNSVLKKTFTLN